MRNFRIYLDDIIDAMEKIESFTAGLSFEEFRSDEKTISAVRDKLIVIGEAAKKIPAEVRDAPPRKLHGGTWQECTDILIHAYFRTDAAMLYKTSKNRIPQQVVLLKKIS